jgi:hypothetical protein
MIPSENVSAPSRMARSIPRRCHVDLRVYDSVGREVAVVMSRTLDRGFHECPFDGGGLNNGVYVCRLEAENFTQARKLVLIK